MFSHYNCRSFLRTLGILLCSLNIVSCAQFLPTTTQASAEQKSLSAEEELLRRKLAKLTDVMQTMCIKSYPLLTVNECFENAYKGIASTIDPHSVYMNAAEYKKFRQIVSNDLVGIGIKYSRVKPATNAVVLEVFPGTSAEAAGILPGDTIVQVNDKLLVQLANAQEISSVIVGSVGTSITLHVVRNEEPVRVFTLIRRPIKNPQMRSVLIEHAGKKYGIIDTVHFGKNFTNDLETHFNKLKKDAGGSLSGLIMSVKNNPGGLVMEAVDTLDFFMDLPQGETGVLERGRTGISIVHFSESDKVGVRKYPGDMTNGIPLLIVVGKGSASSSEIVAGGLQHFNRATIAGKSGTFQKGSMQEIISYRDPVTGELDGSALKITYAEYLLGTTENWIPVQCIGVTPDIMIPTLDKKEQEGINEMGTECQNAKSIPSSKVMTNAPVRASMRDTNPLHFAAAQEMVRVFNEWEKFDQDRYKSFLPKK